MNNTDIQTNQIQETHLFNEKIREISLLNSIEYEMQREAVAKRFGIRVAKLDAFVDEERKKMEERQTEKILFPRIDPWSEAVSLPALLDEIVAILNKYVSFISEHEPKAIALWVIQTYCIEAAYISPLLFVTSAEMRSGKSTLLAIMQKIAYQCIAASSVSPSVIYRLIPKYHPTIILDEADTYLTEKNEDLRGVLNAGHSRDTAGVLRTNPDTLEVEMFDAFGAKCIAAIKGLPSTIEDRSIIVQMRRMPKEQKREKMRLIDEQVRSAFLIIKRKCTRFAADHIGRIRASEPPLPDQLRDRAADNWHILFQIAGLADHRWMEATRKAALHLSGTKQENKSLGIELLEDIHDQFIGALQYQEEVTTANLIVALCSDEEAPWATYNIRRQNPKITPRQLASLLAPYGIKAINNIGHDKRKGYSKASFEDAFSRYIHSDELRSNVVYAT